jgi:hypothetical protein
MLHLPNKATKSDLYVGLIKIIFSTSFFEFYPYRCVLFLFIDHIYKSSGLIGLYIFLK